VTSQAGWLSTRWARLNGPSRLAGVDLARGLAIVGMLAAHLLVITEPFALIEPATWVAIVEGRSSILFATLAGVSIALVTGARTPVVGEARRVATLRLTVRAFALWLLGFVLIFTGVPVFVVLPAYGLMFLLALAFIPFRARTLAVIAAVLAVVMPFVQVFLDALPLWQGPIGDDLSRALGWHYPFTTWTAFVIAGMALARAGLGERRVQGRMLALGAVLTVLAATLAWAFPAPPLTSDTTASALFWSELWTIEPHSSGLLEVIGSGGFAIAMIAACCLLCRTPVTWIVLPLRALGSMPLTAYTAQIFAWALLATAWLGRPGDLAGFRDLDPFWPFTLITLAACTAWALLIGRGPLEWAIDRLTVFAVPPARAR
jgi:uncharacterized membrane protein YeiB